MLVCVRSIPRDHLEDVEGSPEVTGFEQCLDAREGGP
jgi:hypothetical protein